MKYYPSYNRFSLFDDFFNDGDFKPISNALKTDITEKDGYYLLDMEVPGIQKEDIQIELKDGYLMVKASKNTNNEEKDEKGKVIRQERYTGSMSRSFYVGNNVNVEDVQAKFDNGELKITFPSQVKEETKKITIQ